MLIFCHFCNSGYFRNHQSRLRLPHGHSFMKPSDVWWKTKTTHVNEKILDWVTAKLLQLAASPTLPICWPGLQCISYVLQPELGSWQAIRFHFWWKESHCVYFQCYLQLLPLNWTSSMWCFSQFCCNCTRLCSEQTSWLWFGVFSKYAPPPPPPPPRFSCKKCSTNCKMIPTVMSMICNQAQMIEVIKVKKYNFSDGGY